MRVGGTPLPEVMEVLVSEERPCYAAGGGSRRARRWHLPLTPLRFGRGVSPIGRRSGVHRPALRATPSLAVRRPAATRSERPSGGYGRDPRSRANAPRRVAGRGIVPLPRHAGKGGPPPRRQGRSAALRAPYGPLDPSPAASARPGPQSGAYGPLTAAQDRPPKRSCPGITSTDRRPGDRPGTRSDPRLRRARSRSPRTLDPPQAHLQPEATQRQADVHEPPALRSLPPAHEGPRR